MTEIMEIPLSLIICEDQPRKKFDALQLQELADSIRENGLLSPIVVYRNENGATFTLLVGERRYRAHKLLNALTIKSIIREKPSEMQKSSFRLVENTNRADISDLELAGALKRRVDEGESHDAIGKSLGKSRSWVSHHLDILKLPKTDLQALEDGEISYTHARGKLSTLLEDDHSTGKMAFNDRPEVHGYAVPLDKLKVPRLVNAKPTLVTLIEAYELDLVLLKSVKQ